jgi:hypothetical protein
MQSVEIKAIDCIARMEICFESPLVDVRLATGRRGLLSTLYTLRFRFAIHLRRHSLIVQTTILWRS